jgi:arabinan endo-1,5-alpha-L-arabinosidase
LPVTSSTASETDAGYVLLKPATSGSPGDHFGLLDLGCGVQKFSGHDEADPDRGGGSVLDIRPLL